VRATKLQELADMAAKLLAIARELPPGRSGSTYFRRSGDFVRKSFLCEASACSRHAEGRRRGNSGNMVDIRSDR